MRRDPAGCVVVVGAFVGVLFAVLTLVTLWRLM